MITSRVQGTWVIWVLFVNTGKIGEQARVECGGFLCAGVEFEVSGGVSGGYLRGSKVLRKRAIFFIGFPKRSRKVLALLDTANIPMLC